MRKAIILLACLLAVLPAAAHGQAALTLPSLEVDLWPEYDRPEMLVIYHLTLPAGASLPANLSVRIPAAAGKPNAVAARQTDGSLVNLTYTQLASGEWSALAFNATTPEVQIEYYDPGLQKDGSRRSYTYRWPGDYAVTAMTIQVQQPLGASAMAISPSLGVGQAAADGLVYYTAQVGAAPAGQEVSISIEYQKETDALSSETLPVEPSAPIQEQSGGLLDRLGGRSWALILAAVAGVALIVGGGIWYWRSGLEAAAAAPRKRRRKAGMRMEVIDAGEPVYCPQCGKRAQPGDRFCRTCGTTLRK